METRLLRHPCIYMICSPAFGALPAAAKQAIYRRLWSILSGADSAPKYLELGQSQCRAIVEILRAAKSDLPDYFL